MFATTVKTHTDGIWISDSRERTVVQLLSQQLTAAGFAPLVQNSNNYGYPYIYSRGHLQINCRLVDSVFMTDPGIWTNESAVIITDNYPIHSVPGRTISVLPEFWSIWHFEPKYVNRVPVKTFNCFMNRVRGDRSMTFYELIRRDILHEGLISYNCSPQELQNEYVSAELDTNYKHQHQTALALAPYNTVESHGTLEQCIIDSRVSLILETYISDSHIVFSEKLFRCLQMPRPWLLYCSPGALQLLKSYDFDILSDLVDTDYDKITNHKTRLHHILDQLETFIDRQFSADELQRLHQAARHNQQRLAELGLQWPEKFSQILSEISRL